MKKFLLLSVALLLVVCSFGLASGTTNKMKVRQPGLFPLLDHGYSHTWIIDWADDPYSQDGLFNPWQQVLNEADINFEFDLNKVTAEGKDSVEGKIISVKAAPDSESTMFLLLASGLIGLTIFGRKFRRS